MNNTDDQWFEPGTKVVRVEYAESLGLVVYDSIVEPKSDFGNVLCVEECWHQDGVNYITFVGVPRAEDEVWYARCFRRIEEVQLCVRAASKFNQPTVETTI